jgi:hypothetical protein
MRIVALLVLVIGSNFLRAQDITYARKVIDTLASPSMHGRGYVNNGDRIAADYIAGEFKKMGIQPALNNGSYLQPFNFPVNTFPGKVEVTFFWKDKPAVKSDPGEHYLVRSASPSVKGKFEVVKLDSAVVSNPQRWQQFNATSHKKHFVMVDTSGVRNKEQRTMLLNYIKYPKGVKGLLVPVRMNPIDGSDHCSKLTPWDFSMYQSGVPIIEIESEWKDVSEIALNVQAKFIRNYTSHNVLGLIKGSQRPDSFIVFTAHYDHLGRMGQKVYFPGANDNASGVAMLLNLAQHYSKAEHRPKYSILFVAFGAEEVGLIGSKYFVEHPIIDLSKIRFLLNMDILGTGDEGITVVNATLFPMEFKELQRLNAQGSYLPNIKSRGKAAISDHYFFTEKDVTCFYIYTMGGIKAYHDTCDQRETLPLTKFEDLFRLIRDFTDWIDNR